MPQAARNASLFAVAAVSLSGFFAAVSPAAPPSGKQPAAGGKSDAVLVKPNVATVKTVHPFPADSAAIANRIVDRRILPDGSVVTTYGDGRVTTMYTAGGFETKFPDGTVRRANPINVPPTPPPTPPDDAILGAWLDAIDSSLLAQIKGLASNPADIDAYLAAEGQDSPSVYVRINRRMSLLGRMVSGR